MPDVTSDLYRTLVVRHSYLAPRAKVFDAWLDPKSVSRFMAPEGCAVGTAQIDPRIDGAYAITMNTPDGPMTVRGVYREIRRPERIAFTWAWDEDDPQLANESFVTLEFLERDGKTELVLTHERLRDAKSRDSHQHGWTSILEVLERELR